MITADFFKSQNDKLLGFSISGHSGYDDAGKDIVCAAVSSAVMLTANTATEIFKLDAKVRSDENQVCFKLSGEDDLGDKLLISLLNHLYFISNEYPGCVKINLHNR